MRVQRVDLTGIPLHRPSVRAMGLAMGSQMPSELWITKSYVYRGTGVDIYEEAKPTPKPKPQPKVEKPKPPIRKPRPKAKRIKEPGYRPGDEGRAAIARRIESRVPPNRETPTHWTKSIRPAPGFTPLTGEDLEALLCRE